MGYESWHDYGYGIEVDDIKNKDVKRLAALLEQAPVYKAKLEKELADEGIAEPKWADYVDLEGEGLAEIMACVIKEAEGLELTVCSDFNGCTYLMYQAKYPWELDKRERCLTKESLSELLQNYIRILTDEAVNIGDQSCENGG